MATLYADRAFLTVNGVEFQDVESASLKMNDATKPVPSMTRNRRNKGFVKSNREWTGNIVVAVQNKLASPKLEDIDFENNSVALTYEVGADRYTTVDLDLVDMDLTASGVGSEVKKTFNLVATDVIDQVGNSSLFNLSFG
jgi:hypothetical protein